MYKERGFGGNTPNKLRPVLKARVASTRAIHAVHLVYAGVAHDAQPPRIPGVGIRGGPHMMRNPRVYQVCIRGGPRMMHNPRVYQVSVYAGVRT